MITRTSAKARSLLVFALAIFSLSGTALSAGADRSTGTLTTS